MGITKRFEMEFSYLTYELNRAQKEVARARERGANDVVLIVAKARVRAARQAITKAKREWGVTKPGYYGLTG